MFKGSGTPMPKTSETTPRRGLKSLSESTKGEQGDDLVTQARLQKLFDYDPDTGLFTRRVTMGCGRKGALAGSVTNGYIEIRIDKRRYRAHHLAFFYMEGRWPADQIDHIDEDKSNNRIANLREATNAENARNRGAQKNNTSGHKGICWDKQNQKWKAEIMVNGKGIFLGRFDDLNDAVRAYGAAAQKYHGDFANTGEGFPETLNSTWRVADDKKHQWVLQQRRGTKWRGRSFCRTRKSLLRCIERYCGIIDAEALARLENLPEWHDGVEDAHQ